MTPGLTSAQDGQNDEEKISALMGRIDREVIP